MSNAPNRRAVMLAAFSVWPVQGQAQQRRSLQDPMRLGVDVGLHESGLAQALQRGFGRDTGVAVKLIAAPAQRVLQALEQGEVDCALCNSPAAEARLVALGFAHERIGVAWSEFVIVGPLLKAAPQAKTTNSAKPAKAIKPTKPARPAAPRDPAGLMRASSATQALQRLAEAAAADASIRFLSAHDGSGTHAIEEAMWRSAKLAPAARWYQHAAATPDLIAQARRQGSYAFVERGAWAASGGAPLAVLVQGDPLLSVPVHLMRSFRSKHAAAKLFSAWLVGPKGRYIVAARSGYRTLS